MFRASKAIALLGALGVSACLVACSSDGGQGEGVAEGQPSVVPGVGDNFDRRNMVVTAVCSSGNSNTVIYVDGWDPKNWQHMAHAEFRLPETTVTKGRPSKRATAVRELCDLRNDEVPDADDISEIRALFDQHFTKMAVVTYDQQSGASHVGYVDRSGRFIDVTGAETFGVTPKEEAASLSRDGNTMWLTYEARATNPNSSSTVESRVASRAVTEDGKLVDHWKGGTPAESLVILGTSGTVVVNEGARIAPDGRHLTVGSRVIEAPAGTNVLVSQSGRDLGRALPCDGEVAGWVDNDTVLCGGGRSGSDRLATVDITPGAQRGAPILPENDRDNYAMAVSPDGQQFVFVSAQRTSKEYYLSATTPGSTPVKIERTDPFSTLGDTAVFVEWR